MRHFYRFNLKRLKCKMWIKISVSGSWFSMTEWIICEYRLCDTLVQRYKENSLDWCQKEFASRKRGQRNKRKKRELWLQPGISLTLSWGLSDLQGWLWVLSISSPDAYLQRSMCPRRGPDSGASAALNVEGITVHLFSKAESNNSGSYF